MPCSKPPTTSRTHVAIRLQVSTLTLTPSLITCHWLPRTSRANTERGASVVITSESRILLYLSTWTVNVSICAAFGYRGLREDARRCSFNTWLPCRMIKQKQRHVDPATPLGPGVWDTTNNALRLVDITLRLTECNDTGPKENPTLFVNLRPRAWDLCSVASQSRAPFASWCIDM